MAIKAIETEYKGYRFRSRLEARWAVFFDALGFKWEYEPEGFTYSDVDGMNLSYLPDFRLPGGLYVEVKPDNGEVTSLEIYKVVIFAEHHPIILVYGLPDCIAYEVIRRGPYPFKTVPRLNETAEKEKGIFFIAHWTDANHPEWVRGNPGERWENFDLELACMGAKQARFEHQEDKPESINQVLKRLEHQYMLKHGLA